MIIKISKLKNFGIFQEFSWKTDLPDFKKYNLIYGWNRSGKSTISRIFSSCEKKLTYDINKFNQYPTIFDDNGGLINEGEFEIKTDDGTIVKNTDVATNALQIRVFNQDFIKENISFEPSDYCNPIVYLSEGDIEGKKKLDQLKLDKINIGKTYEQAKKDKLAKEETKNTFLTGLGREIANILFDKTYNKTKTENKINSIGIDNFTDKTLSEEDKQKYEAISKSEAGEQQANFTDFKFSFSFGEDIIDSFQKIFEKVVSLLGKKVISETLDRLKNDQILNTWVKQGFDLHKTKAEKVKCLFCQKPLDDDFLTTLSKHFSKDYEDLQNAITSLKSKILDIKRLEIATKNDDLYPDLKDKFTSQVEKLNTLIKKTYIWIDEAVKKLEEKYNNPLEVVINPEIPEDFLALYNKVIAETNEIIDDHNKKVKNHSFEVSKAKEKLEVHVIAHAVREQDYKKMVTDLEEALKNENEALIAVNKNKADIAELEQQTSEICIAIKTINKYLEELFGRKEIELALDRDSKGYVIKRDGKPANNLSEGEKTAIAFSYFIVKVGESDFNKSKGIIFIDDPISSFDSNFVYHCNSMIKSHFAEVGQLFISTHNFQFFNLIKDWFNNKNDSTNKNKLRLTNKAEKPIPCEFFMVENFIESDIRKAKIVELEETLRKYKSEYHFLFTKLKEFSEKQDTEYEDLYTIGNIARRFFDIFADFKIPTTGNPKSKMDVLIKNINNPIEKISTVDAGKAYKLVNEFSHNSDSTSFIEHKDKSEIKDAIRILLKIVKKSDPNHFAILDKNQIQEAN